MKRGAGKDKRLRVRVSRGVLTIEVGVGVLAHAATHLDWTPDGGQAPAPAARVTNAGGFAVEVASALEDELGEDGSSILTTMLDQAIRRAIDDGAEYFVLGWCPYPDKHASDCNCEGAGGDR